MKVYVVFDIPGIDPDSEDADDIIDVLEEAIDELGYCYYIDDTTED
jgi:hypothetical protein